MLCVVTEDGLGAAAVNRVHRVVGQVNVTIMVAAVVAAEVVFAKAAVALLKHTLTRGFGELTKT